MKQVMVQLDQFRGILANRTEQIMCRSKHSDKVKVVDTYSDRFNERTDLVKIPISAEIIVCRKYEDANMKEFSISRIQNGKTEMLCQKSDSVENLSTDEYNFFFEDYDSAIEELQKKGYSTVVS